MKKALSLLLALVLCLSLCACGSGTVSPAEDKSENTGDTAEKLEDKLAGMWYCLNFEYDFGLCLNADGTEDYYNLNWTVSGDTVTFTRIDDAGKEHTHTYQLHCINGQYLMVGEGATYYHDSPNSATDALTFTPIELTVNNWQEYFEYQTHTTVQKDQFGEVTGESTAYFVRLKPEYYQRLQVNKSKVLIRYTTSDINDNLDTACESQMCDTICFYGWYLSSDPAEFPVEMVRIEGNISLANFG